MVKITNFWVSFPDILIQLSWDGAQISICIFKNSPCVVDLDGAWTIP